MAAPRHVLLFGSTASFSGALAPVTGWQFTVAPSPAEVVETFRSINPDVVLLGATDFAAHAAAMLAIRAPPIVCLGPSDASVDAARGTCDRGASAWLPIDAPPVAVATTIEQAIRWTERLEAAINEKQALSQMLETRKLVERAKAIFMRRLSLDEPTAHKRLQQESQNRRIALAELARRIIESDEMLAGSPDATGGATSVAAS